MDYQMVHRMLAHASNICAMMKPSDAEHGSKHSRPALARLERTIYTEQRFGPREDAVMSALLTLTPAEVRRLAITRQHLDAAPRPSVLDVLRDIGCLQLDPIQHVDRSHWLVLHSRLGAFDRADFERLLWTERALFEYWAHEASIVLTEDFPLHAYRMRRFPGHSAWAERTRAWLEENAAVIEPLMVSMTAHLRKHGPSPARELASDDGVAPWISSGWTNDTRVNRLIDLMWQRGELFVAGRKGNTRLWGLPEQVLPDWTPREELDAAAMTQRAAQRSLRALGVATPGQIRAHFVRRRYVDLPHVLAALVVEGRILPIQVQPEGGKAWPGAWYLHAEDLPLLERIRAGNWQGRAALLSPFDNLICDRGRTRLLFDFDYTIQIYTPREKRQYGYYAMPLLLGDRLVGRVDAQMDRKQSVLRVDHVYLEPGAPDDDAALAQAAAAFQSLARFLGAQRIDLLDLPPTWARLARAV